MRDLFPTMERLVTDSFRAVYKKIDPERNKNAFEIFGYDFMIDENFKVYLIEANTNPCLEICCPLLARIIPELLDNSFRLTLDPLYQPPTLLEERQLQPALDTTPKGKLAAPAERNTNQTDELQTSLKRTGTAVNTQQVVINNNK